METMQSLNRAAKSIDELAIGINHKLQLLTDNTNNTLKSIDELALTANRNIGPLANNTNTTLRDAQKALRDIDALLNENSTQVYNLSIALEEITRAARSIRIFAETIERQPETLLKGKKP